MYPTHYKAWRAPEINLPFGGQMSKVIRKYFDITNVLAEDDPQKNAVCKTCGKAIVKTQRNSTQLNSKQLFSN